LNVGDDDYRRTRQQIENYESFRDTLDDTLDALANGELSLRHAAQRRVQIDAAETNPAYLRTVQREGKGATLAARVANNLVGHLRLRADAGRLSATRKRELEMELQAFSLA